MLKESDTSRYRHGLPMCIPNTYFRVHVAYYLKRKILMTCLDFLV